MISRKTFALSSVMLVGLLVSPPTRAQDVDVQAGDTAVQVDRSGVQSDAQSTQQANRADRQRQNRLQSNRQQRTAGANMDRQIAQWLIVDQQNIINLAQYGVQRSKTPQVRELAEAIVRDHEAFASKLREANLENPANSPAAESVRGEQREAAREARRDAARDEDGERRPIENVGDRLEEGIERLADRAERVVDEARDGLDRAAEGDRTVGGARWINIHQEIIQKVEEVARQDLQKREGYEFEAAFVGMVVASHLQQEATLEVLSDRASGDLAQTLERALASVKQHRQRAEQVMGQIGKEQR